MSARPDLVARVRLRDGLRKLMKEARDAMEPQAVLQVLQEEYDDLRDHIAKKNRERIR